MKPAIWNSKIITAKARKSINDLLNLEHFRCRDKSLPYLLLLISLMEDSFLPVFRKNTKNNVDFSRIEIDTSQTAQIHSLNFLWLSNLASHNVAWWNNEDREEYGNGIKKWENWKVATFMTLDVVTCLFYDTEKTQLYWYGRETSKGCIIEPNATTIFNSGTFGKHIHQLIMSMM